MGLNGFLSPFGLLQQNTAWGAWVAQSVKDRTLDFSSDHNLTVMRWSPALGSGLTAQSLLGILSLLLSLSVPSPTHDLQINK